jgi:hypothetical protein
MNLQNKSLRLRGLHMHASRCFRGGGQDSGRHLRRFSGPWKLLLLLHDLHRRLDTLCQLRPLRHDSHLRHCFVRRSVLYTTSDGSTGTRLPANQQRGSCKLDSVSRSVAVVLVFRDVITIQESTCASGLRCQYRCRQDDSYLWPCTRLCSPKKSRLLSQASEHRATTGCR